MLAKTLNRILMPMKKTPKSGCDKVYRVRNSFQKNQISAPPKQIFSKNYQIFAIFPVFCNVCILFDSFSQIKAKIRACHEISMKIDPKNVKIGQLEAILDNFKDCYATQPLSEFALLETQLWSARHGSRSSTPMSYI